MCVLLGRANNYQTTKYIRITKSENNNASTTNLQDHPGLRGTPLAMLAAQCNKLSSKSPPPLADAAVGKGFHPWKKSPQQQLAGHQSPPSAPLAASTANASQRSLSAAATATATMGQLSGRWVVQRMIKTYLYYCSIVFSYTGGH